MVPQESKIVPQVNVMVCQGDTTISQESKPIQQHLLIVLSTPFDLTVRRWSNFFGVALKGKNNILWSIDVIVEEGDGVCPKQALVVLSVLS